VSRSWGLGSVYGKSLRDARRPCLATGGFLGFTVLVAGMAMASSYGAPQARAQIADFALQAPAALRGMYGEPERVGTLGGFLAWQYAGFFGLIAGLWSILALGSTISAEAERRSLDFLLTSPLTRRRVALEKGLAHITAMVLAMAIFSICLWLTGTAWGREPGDGIDRWAAAAFGAHVGLLGLAAGMVAFLISAFVGRRASIGTACALMFGGYVAQGWESVLPALSPVAWLSPFRWLRSDVPLAGSYAWSAQVALALVVAGLLLASVEAFARGEGRVARLRLPSPRPLPIGLRGPISRAFADRLAPALGFGVGLAVYGFVIAAASPSFAGEMIRSAAMARLFDDVFPGSSIATQGGALQIAYCSFAYVVAGLAAAVFVAGCASDEASGRLGLALSTPVSRAGLALRVGAGSYGAIALVDILAAAGVACGCLLNGIDLAPAAGTLVLGLYAAALAGVGLAIAGLVRPSIAGPSVAALAIGIFFLGLFGGVLRFPDAIMQLNLAGHLGRPLQGAWDPVGIFECAVLGIGGLLVGAWGLAGRDLTS
jgi:ABC-2 type transport system permease protein